MITTEHCPGVGQFESVQSYGKAIEQRSSATSRQVFLHSFPRQSRPKIVTNDAAGSELNAACFIGSMSSEAAYIEIILRP